MKQGKNSLKLVWGITMVIVYLAMAIMLVATPLFEKSSIPKTIRIAIAILFFVYGLFRAYRIWKQE